MEMSAEVKAKIQSKWDSFEELSSQQISYLKTRAIDYEKVKKYIRRNGEYVACAIFDLSGLISIQNRTASATDKRFMIEKGSNSKGVFITDINPENKMVYVVEGMFDFLSLAQYAENVIGLKSAKDGTEIVKAFYHKGYRVIVIPDNDEAGRNMLKDLEDIKYSMFDLEHYEVKDINELLVESQYGPEILTLIEDERTKEPINIDRAFDKFAIVQKAFSTNGGRLGESSPFPMIDQYTQGVIRGKVYVIG